MYGIKLKQLRERNALTQEQLAMKINIDRKTYSNYENEDSIMPIKHLNYLCNFFQISFDYIFDFSNKNQYNNTTLEIDLKVSGNRLKEFRKENRLTQTKLAKTLNIAFSLISDYEHGKLLISTHALYDICKNYHISADYLLGKTNNPKYFS